MAAHEGTAVAWRSRPAPGVVAPTTRVNVALPFSKITVEEPGWELAELAAIVAGLAAAVERGVAEPGAAGAAQARRRPGGAPAPVTDLEGLPMAGSPLAPGSLLGVAAVVLIIVPVRLAGRPDPPSPGSALAA